jgi:hypothetical protein
VSTDAGSKRYSTEIFRLDAQKMVYRFSQYSCGATRERKIPFYIALIFVQSGVSMPPASFPMNFQLKPFKEKGGLSKIYNELRGENNDFVASTMHQSFDSAVTRALTKLWMCVKLN